MLCLDIRSLIAYLQGEEGADVDLIGQALLDQVGILAEVCMSTIPTKLPDDLLKTSTKRAESLCLSQNSSLDRPDESTNRAASLSTLCVLFRAGDVLELPRVVGGQYVPHQERWYR